MKQRADPARREHDVPARAPRAGRPSGRCRCEHADRRAPVVHRQVHQLVAFGARLGYPAAAWLRRAQRAHHLGARARRRPRGRCDGARWPASRPSTSVPSAPRSKTRAERSRSHVDPRLAAASVTARAISASPTPPDARSCRPRAAPRGHRWPIAAAIPPCARPLEPLAEPCTVSSTSTQSSSPERRRETRDAPSRRPRRARAECSELCRRRRHDLDRQHPRRPRAARARRPRPRTVTS